jgi:hypothetical protein
MGTVKSISNVDTLRSRSVITVPPTATRVIVYDPVPLGLTVMFSELFPSEPEDCATETWAKVEITNMKTIIAIAILLWETKLQVSPSQGKSRLYD